MLEATLNLPSIETGESKHSKTKSATARHVTNIPWTVCRVSLVGYDQHKDVSYKSYNKDCYYCNNLQNPSEVFVHGYILAFVSDVCAVY